jgi:DNA-binding Lrp family transcriptional regulator
MDKEKERILLVMAYVLLNANLGAEGDLLEGLRKIPEVKAAYVVYGVYDIVLFIEAETMVELNEIVADKIRRAFSDKTRRDEEHIRECPTCGAFFNKTLRFDALSHVESGHLFKFLQSYIFIDDPLRSTLTLPVVEAGPSTR